MPTPSEPGWYPDSRHADLLRHWSGTAWGMVTKPNELYVAPVTEVPDASSTPASASTPAATGARSPLVNGQWTLRDRPTPPTQDAATYAAAGAKPAEREPGAEPVKKLDFTRVRTRPSSSPTTTAPPTPGSAPEAAPDSSPAFDVYATPTLSAPIPGLPAPSTPAALAPDSGATAAAFPPSAPAPSRGISMDDDYDQFWSNTAMFGPRLSAKSARIIRDASAAGEMPTMVLANSEASAIVIAFSDRLLLVRIAKLTSFKPAGKPVIVPFADIASIDFSAQPSPRNPIGELVVTTSTSTRHSVAITPTEHQDALAEITRLKGLLQA